MINLTHPKGKVIVQVNLEGKNTHTFEDGTKIRLERQYNNLNFRETSPVNAIVVSAEHMPKGSSVLIHHNSTHDVNKIFDYTNLSGEVVSSDIQYYSIPEHDCYLYKEQKETEYKPCNGFVTALRLFKPYSGNIDGILPTLVKNKLFITSGEYKNIVCDVLKSSDYQIVYQGDDGREKNVIRVRHFEGEQEHERQEIIALDHYSTKLVYSGKLLIGLNNTDCKSLK